jgi:hypothetical protein
MDDLKWMVEAERTLDALRRLKTEGPVEFWTRPMVEHVRVDAEKIAVREGKPSVYGQHVLRAAADVMDKVNTERWYRRMRRRKAA